MLVTMSDGSQQDAQPVIILGATKGQTWQTVLETDEPELLFPPRATRRNAAVFNMDDTDDVLWGYGDPPETREDALSKGFPLPRRSAIPIDTTLGVWAIAMSGTPRVAIAEGYD